MKRLFLLLGLIVLSSQAFSQDMFAALNTQKNIPGSPFREMALRNDLSAEVIADIVNYTSAQDGQAYIVLGQSAKGDRTFRVYYYDAASTATPTGDLILTATGMGVGRFIKITENSAGAGISIDAATGEIAYSGATPVNADWNASSGLAQILNKPAIPNAPTYTFNNAPNRSLNSNFTPSATGWTWMNYTANIAYNVTGLISSSGAAFLEYSTNGGTNWNTIASASNMYNIGVVIAGNNDYNLSGSCPPNALVRIRSSATNSTVTITNRQQEMVLTL